MKAEQQTALILLVFYSHRAFCRSIDKQQTGATKVLQLANSFKSALKAADSMSISASPVLHTPDHHTPMPYTTYLQEEFFTSVRDTRWGDLTTNVQRCWLHNFYCQPAMLKLRQWPCTRGCIPCLRVPTPPLSLQRRNRGKLPSDALNRLRIGPPFFNPRLQSPALKHSTG